MAIAVTTASGAIRRESWRGLLVSKLIRSSSPVDRQADFGGLRDSYVGNRLRMGLYTADLPRCAPDLVLLKSNGAINPLDVPLLQESQCLQCRLVPYD